MLATLGPQLKPFSSYRRMRWRSGAPIFWGIADQGGSLIDASDSRVAITSNGGVTPRAGNFGPALTFDGTTGYLQSPGYVPLAGLSSCSLSVRFRQTGGSSSQWVAGFIADAYGDPTCGIYIGYQKINGYVYTTGSSVVSATSTQTTFPDGKWHHAAFAYNGISATLYLDSLVVAATAATGTIRSTVANGLQIGACYTFGTTVGDYFTGSIDDVRIYNYALTQSQVTIDYLDPWWRLRRRRPWWMGISGSPPPVTKSTFFAGAGSSGFWAA